jgi:hypothetical protein
VGDLLVSLLGLLVGSLPQRQPWRSIVTALYLAGAVVGVTVLTCLSMTPSARHRNDAVHRLLEHLRLRCEARRIEADWFKDEWTAPRAYAVLDRAWATEASGDGQLLTRSVS